MKTVRLLLFLVLVLCGCSGPAILPAAVIPTSTPLASSPLPATSTPAAVETATPRPSPSPSPLPSKTLPQPAAAVSQPATVSQLAFPIRAAFYYPWFPQAWNQSHINPFTQYHPALGLYRSDDMNVIRQQIEAMKYGKIQLGIASWWGQGHHTDTHVADLLSAGQAANFYWALYVESEGIGDPSADAIRADLVYIRDHYATSPAYLKVNGKFLVFVYAQPEDSCSMADRWKQANSVGAYVVLKVFPGYRNCASQPDAWHQYAPANAQKQQGQDSYTISPGFWKAGEEVPLLDRNLAGWSKSIQAMIASKANFQLITTFNEWGEGTAIENAKEWASPSGYGLYLDALHADGAAP